MRWLGFATLSLLATVASASSWVFEDATLSIQGKGGVGSGTKEKLSPTSPLQSPVTLGSADTLKIVLTALDGKTGKRPHQAFLTLREQSTGLEESFPFSVKENGKAKVDVTQKDLPFQFITTNSPVAAYIVLGSFGSSVPHISEAFSIKVNRDSPTFSVPEAPVRYGKLPEINHIFKSDPRSPPRIISAFFTLAVIGTLPALLGAWLLLGANVNHISKALSRSPVSHVLFYGSILALEGIFFLYYTTWNLFQTLPAAGIAGAVAFISGSRALSEVQERRLAGER